MTRYIIVVCPSCGEWVGTDRYTKVKICPHTYPTRLGQKPCRQRIQIQRRKVIGTADTPQKLALLLQYLKEERAKRLSKSSDIGGV